MFKGVPTAFKNSKFKSDPAAWIAEDAALAALDDDEDEDDDDDDQAEVKDDFLDRKFDVHLEILYAK
jgi:hypothetical protein